jgi:hypothetical protein
VRLLAHHARAQQRDHDNETDRFAEHDDQMPETQRFAALQRGDDAEQQHGENVVDNGCAEDDAAFFTLQDTEFLQHARGDAGRSCHERCGDEQRPGPVEP